jgi:energy-coupling factor transporter ATP-binding protein EcfA2
MSTQHGIALESGSWHISGIDTSDHARVQIGHSYQHNYHHYYGDESLMSPVERKAAREDAVLSSLSFPDMSARERTIDKPCDDTFNWIFDERVTVRQRYYRKEFCILMSRWLEHENGMFFIAGKAGSGKSTLVRFLAGHEQTRALLRTWARRNHCDLEVYAHYFWCSGSQLQSSQEGLWRSILYTIAKGNRELASVVFAGRACDDDQAFAQLRTQPWARNDLISALSLLIAQLEVQKVAVCLFIDGLDEYQGNEVMLIAELNQLLASPYIKICASSRPRNLFEEAFGREDYKWKLALHLLTRDDMVQLAHTRLDKDAAFRELFNDADLREDFITTIADRSQGVFLWTVLVIREMVREAHQAGTIDELKERLNALPVELGGREGLYQRIVERSDPRYQKYMAQLLLVMLEAWYPGVYWKDVHFLYRDARNVVFVTQECLDLDDKYRIPWNKEIDQTATQRWESANSNISCRGLFLACYQGRSGAHGRGINCQVHQDRLIEDTKQQIRKWCPDFVDTHDNFGPDFMHRSVGEYLSLPEIRDGMINLAGRGFDPLLTRCRLRLAHLHLKPGGHHVDVVELEFLKMLACVGYERRDFVRTNLTKFKCIQDAKCSVISTNGHERDNVLDHFWARGLCYIWSTQDIVLHGGFDTSQSSQTHAWFLSLVAREMVWYCREQWSSVPRSERQATGIIIIAGLVFNMTILTMSKEQTDLVQYLLRCGVNPNTKYTWTKGDFDDYSTHVTEMSLWETFIKAFPKVWTSHSGDHVRRALEVMRLLLHDGHADKECCLPAGKKSLLSALKFESHLKELYRDRQNRWWSMFAEQLHVLLHAHGLLTREERDVAREQGWIDLE